MGDKTVPAILAFLLIVAIFGLMAWGWRSRLKRQADVAELPAVPEQLGAASLSVDGTYVVTTSSGDWLDRIAAHGLGIRTTAKLDVHPEGIVLHRSGAQDLFIAKDALTEVGTQSGMAGKFVEKDGLVAIGWRLGEKSVDTGFRTTEAAAKRPLVQALEELLPHGGTEDLPDADISRKNDENE